MASKSCGTFGATRACETFFPVIALTAHAMAGDGERFLAAVDGSREKLQSPTMRYCSARSSKHRCMIGSHYPIQQWGVLYVYTFVASLPGGRASYTVDRLASS